MDGVIPSCSLLTKFPVLQRTSNPRPLLTQYSLIFGKGSFGYAEFPGGDFAASVVTFKRVFDSLPFFLFE